MRELFETILYQPIFNGFIGLYNIIPDVGAVVLILTLLIKGALFPLSRKSIKAQKDLQELQPKLEALKKKHGDDKQATAQATMELYKEHKVNPLGSCLPLLVQLPVFLGLFYVLRDVFETQRFDLLYPFVAQPEFIDPMTLGLFDLSTPSIVLALLAGAAQFWQARSMQSKRAPKTAGKGGKDENMMAMVSKQTMYFMPIITIVIGMRFPAGLTLYWFLSTLITAIQQHVMLGNGKKDKDKKDGVVEGKLVE